MCVNQKALICDSFYREWHLENTIVHWNFPRGSHFLHYLGKNSVKPMTLQA